MSEQGLPEGTVTVLFTDVEGSTDLTTRRGDEAAREVLRAHEDLVRRHVHDHEGHEVKAMGDGFMVAFASARRAVACAVGIQRALEEHNHRQPPDQRLRVRIGLNAGEVIREDADLFGAAVNAAARIAAKTDGSQILVSETVKSLVGRAKNIRFADRGRFRLKGFPERWRLFEVIWQEESAAVAAPALAERTPFVGRETERADLQRLLEQAVCGQGALAMIGGEPGVGKTRLAEELMAEARGRSMTALIGRCYEMEGAPPYIVFVEMLEAAARTFPPEALRDALGDSAPEVAKLMPELRRMFPDIPLPPELPPEQERRYLFNGMRDFLVRAGRAQPLLLVLDDLHWADDSTMLLVQHIAQQLHEMPVLIVGTYRDVELDVGRPLARALEELLRQRLAHRISLRRLPEDGVSAMLRALSGQDPPPPLVQAIYSETEGNPFFVEEVFQHLAEEGKLFDDQGRWRSDLQVSELDVPEGVRLVIGRRLERVGEECTRVLTSAAVIGRGFSFELLEALADADPDTLLDAIDQAERAQLITAAEDVPAQTGARMGEARFTFAHELIRQTLVSGLSLPRRQRLHLRIAEAMERVYARVLEEHAADLAHHLHQAGTAADPEKTVRYLTLAAQRAIAAAAFEDGLRLYETALQTIDLMEDDERRRELVAELHAKRGMALARLGRSAEARPELEAALEGLTPERTERRAELLVNLSQVCFWLLDTPSTRRHATDALALAERTGRTDLVVAAMGALAGAHGADGDLVSSIDQYQRALDRAGGLRLASTPFALQQYSLTLYWHGRLDEAAERAREAVQASREVDISQMMYALPHLGLALAGSGRYDEAMGAFEEARLIGRKYGVGTLLARSIAMSAGLHMDVFDFAGAEALQEEARELARSLSFPPPLVSASIDLLLNFARRQEVGRGEKLVGEVAAAVEKAAGWHGWLWKLRLAEARAEMALARGDWEEALRWASDAIKQSRAKGRVKYQAAGLQTRAQALAARGRTKEAISDLRRTVALVRPVGDPAMLLRAATALLAIEGDEALAAEASQAAQRIAAALPDAEMRRRFEAAEPVRMLSRFAR